MTSIGYVIATYSGNQRNHITDNKDFTETCLFLQLTVLYDILYEKHIQKIPNLITDVIVICPKFRGEFLTNYYKMDYWFEKFNALPKTYIHFVNYKGKNKFHSYDQWIQGYMFIPYLDYYIVIEDDYCIRPQYLEFDTDIVKVYRDILPDNIGYMSTHVAKNEHGTHSLISNGIISRDTWKKIPDPLQRYYAELVTVNNQVYNMHFIPQVRFSHLFTLHQIRLADYSKFYAPCFWNSTDDRLEFYNKKAEKNPVFFLPVQSISLFNLNDSNNSYK